MRIFNEHRLLHYNVRDFGQTAKTPKPMVMNQSLSANGKGIVQGPITTTNVKNGHLVGGAALPKAPTPSLPVGTGVAALDWAGRSQSHPQYGIPPSNPTEQQLNERYGVTPGWGVPNQGPNGSIDPRTGLQYSNSNNPGFGGGLQTTYNAIDAKYRAASDAGQSVDPTAVAAEKQAAAAQFQAEESARQGQMQAARDKEAKSVAMSQNALTAKTPQGQKIQQITAIRQNVRLGKITQEQANAQIQQIQSQSAASPQSPVAAPTSPTPTPANPNASTATTPAVPGAAAVGTQEASATGTEPVDANGTPVATTPQTPEEAGMDAAMLNLPPEAAFLAPFLQSLKTQTDKSIEENAQMALGQLATVEKTFGGIQDKLDGMEAGYKSTTEAMQSLLREAKESQEKQIAEAEKDQMNRVQWQQDTQERVIMKNKRQAHEAMVAQLALNGGFGQDASLRAVAESDDHFETQLADLRTEMGYARTDLSVKFSGLKNEATQNYVNSTITNMKELQANLEKISFQGMSNKVSKMQAEQSIVKDAWEKQNTLRSDLANKQYTIAKDMQAIVNADKDHKLQQEQLGFSILNAAYDNYKGNIPKTILDRVAKLVPGLDANQLLGRRSAGGGGMGGFGAAGGIPDPTGIASQYANMTPQQLSSAVDRAMLKFGGTGAERNRKRAEYMSRIANGESAGTIVSDLVNDYWATTTGDAEKHHNDRITAAGNMDTILNYTKTYGVTEEDDGPLGPVESRVEWLKSFFGQSSDAYNNIRSITSNVKGQITRQNSGTAVSAYEMALLKEYLPSMDLKGPSYFANVQNYKKLVQYLDAKQAATDLGLPPPPLPTPIKYSGNSIAGPGKFSTDDMLSTMNE